MDLDNETTPHSGEVANGITEDQAAEALLEKWGAKEDASPDSDEAEESTDDQPEGDDQPEEAEATEDDESGEIEIDVAGEKFKAPKALSEVAKRIEAKAKEVEAGATRKFQEAAEQRKAAELTATQAKQQQHFNQAQAHLLGELTLVTRRMQLFEQMDLNSYADDPAQLTRINAEYNQLRSARERIGGELQRVHTLFTKDQEEVQAKRYAAAAEFAKANIKDWSSDGGKRHAAYAAKRGLAPSEVEALLLMDPRVMLILDDAEYGARARSAQPKQKIDPSKTLKPGASGGKKFNALPKAEAAFQRLKKTGTTEDAAMALLMRQGARKK